MQGYYCTVEAVFNPHFECVILLAWNEFYR